MRNDFKRQVPGSISQVSVGKTDVRLEYEQKKMVRGIV